MLRIAIFSIIYAIFVTQFFGQVFRVPSESLGERLIAIVPMVGKGTAEDPFRPKYAPVTPTAAAIARMQQDGTLARAASASDEEKISTEKRRIGAYSSLLTDDRKRAIVQFVARDREAFVEILKDPEVEIIDPAKLEQSTEVTKLQRLRKDFDPSQLKTAGY